MKTLWRMADLDEVRRRIRTLEPGHTARWGRMSVHQMLCHLADGCRMATGALAVRPVGARPRAIRKWVALRLPVSWPAGLPTCPELDQRAGGGTPPAAFAVDVAVLLDLVTQVATAPGLDGRPHPVFGRMSRGDWLRWAYLHLDHHLRQFGA